LPRIDQLACPHCQAPITLKIWDFFPQRWHPILCPSCTRFAVLPVPPVLIGIAGLLLIVSIELLFLKEWGFTRTDTIAEVVLLGTLSFGLAALGSWLASHICRAFVNHLQTGPRRR
jgi:hypothetical protein